ncbi:MAG: pyridoxal-phosphate dependent enzyme, partial [Thermomicrobiales bacterium]
EYTDRLVNVSEAQLHDAIRWLAKHHGIIAEGAGAAATAAILADMIELNGSDVVAVISGRNIALPKLAAILTEQDA